MRLFAGLFLLGGLVWAAPVVLSGKVSIKGNEPFTFVALTTADGRVFSLTGEKAKELWGYQNHRVFVWGEKEGEEKPGEILLIPRGFRVESYEPHRK